MSSSLGVTMALPAGTLEARRTEELSRRQQKQEQEKQQLEEEPRRLAPQRGKKKQSTTSANTVLNNTQTPREQLPINITINIQDDVELNQDDCDDANDDMRNITNNVADWTLNNADKTTSNYLKDNTDNIDDDSEKEQSYHGEIESVVEESADGDDNLDIDEESDDGGFKIISENDVPLDPPPESVPLVLVDLEMLCGCVPYDEEEKEVVVSQVIEMLLGSVPEEVDNDDQEQCEDNNKSQSSQQDLTKGDGLSLHFDERVSELFETGVAMHVDSMMRVAMACVDAEKKVANKVEATTSTAVVGKREKVHPFTLIPYPEFLSSEMSPSSRSTMRLWKLLNNTHQSPLLNRIFHHLRNTSRSLIWKADMYQELCRLANQEYKARIKREQMTEYSQWKETVRKERLEKLYDVRETFQLRVDVARRKHEAFVEERELRVERELKRRGLYQYRITSQKHSEDNSNEEEEYYDEDGWGGAIKEEEIFGGEIDDIEDGKQDDGDEWSPLGLNIAINRVGSIKDGRDSVQNVKQEDGKLKHLEPITHSDNQSRKTERRQKLKDQTTAVNNTFFEKKEAAIREALKTNDERIAEAVLANLEDKLNKVDELLESLQEEEWADEEEDNEVTKPLLDANNGKIQASDDLGDQSEMTLLDQILAMILGGLSKESSGAPDDKEHFSFVKREHASIVSSWKETFGRLPPFPSSEPPEITGCGKNDTLDNHFGDYLPSEMGKSLSNEDWNADRNEKLTLLGNETSNWDEVDDW
ncbi:hypothetical protein ACHAWC_001859, partial [Mediolabrus comicus]